ncbi:MAG: TRAP transporter substrate-binding protein [Gammaproteobacteria bacterium]
MFDQSKSMLARLLSPVTCVLGLTFLVACGPSKPGAVTVAGTTFPDTVGEEHWLAFEQNVKAASGESIELRMLIYGQLGSEEQIISGLRRGRVHFANLSALVVSTIVPEIALLYAPYLFESEAEADYVYDQYLTDVFRDMLAEQDLHLITWYEIGFLNVYGKQPIVEPRAASGVRFRVGASESARLFARSIGADVIPLGFGEVVSSLQTGLIEAGENAVSLYARTGIAQEAPHLTLTRHAFGTSVIVTRKSWWDGLDAESQTILQSAYPELRESREAIRAESARDLENAAQLGIHSYEPNRQQLESWRQVTRKNTDELVQSIGGRAAEIMQLIEKGKREFSARQNARGIITATDTREPATAL